MTRIKIKIKEIVHDVVKVRMDDTALMEKYAINTRQLTYVLGKLATEKRIPIKRLIASVEAHLDAGRLETALGTINVVKGHFANLRGIKSLISTVEFAYHRKQKLAEFEEYMGRHTVLLDWFLQEFPNISLSPELERMIRLFNVDGYLFHESVSEQGLLSVSLFANPSEKNLVWQADIAKGLYQWKRERLRFVATHHKLWAGLGKLEANRMWHYVSLKHMESCGHKSFIVLRYQDMTRCGVCLRISGVIFNVSEITAILDSQLKSGSLMPHKLPEFDDVSRERFMTQEDKMRIIKENSWFLPPYCDACRCQISAWS